MALDYPTIFFFLAINNLFIIVLFTYQYFYHHKEWYLLVFIAGVLFQTIAIILIGNRSVLPFLYTVQISNFFMISSFALTSFGLISFDGLIRKKIMWVFLVFTFLFFCSFLALQESKVLRIIIQIISSSFFYGIGAFYLFSHKKKFKFSIILSIVLLQYSIFQFFRAYTIYQIGDSYDFMKGSTIDNWILIISLFTFSISSIGFIMLLKEIDEKTIILKNKKIQEDKLKFEELNRTKDKLFSIIAHDLRSPFNSILGFSELIIENLENLKVADIEKNIGIINLSAKNTLILLDNLLNWAKSQTGQIKFNPKKIIIASIIRKTIETSNSAAKIKNISLNSSQLKEIIVSADENMLLIVLRNLMSNAIKFTKVGGQINVTVTSEHNLVEITISDNGVGVKEEIRKNLFKTTTNITSRGTENENGSGLGLILCKEFVEKQGGHIWVESAEGKGSDFKFTLPLYKS